MMQSELSILAPCKRLTDGITHEEPMEGDPARSPLRHERAPVISGES